MSRCSREDDELPPLAATRRTSPRSSSWRSSASARPLRVRSRAPHRARRAARARRASRSRPRARRSSARPRPDRRPPPRAPRARPREGRRCPPGRRGRSVRSSRLSRPRLPEALLVQPRLEALATPAEGLVDRLGRGGKPALEDGEREADDVPAPSLALSLAGARRGSSPRGRSPSPPRRAAPLRGRAGTSPCTPRRSGKSGLPSKVRSSSLTIRRMRPCASSCFAPFARLALEPVLVDERHEELEVLGLARCAESPS